MTPLDDAAGGGRRQGRPDVRRTADAVALGPTRAEHRLGFEPDRHAGAARGRRRGSGRHLQPRAADSGSRVAFSPRRDHLRLARRRRDERRRILGSAQHRVHQAACRCCSSSRTTATRSRCRSKCRRPAATSHGSCDRFPDFTSIRSTAPISSPAFAPCARRPPTSARARVRRSSTRASSGRTRTPCRTTRSCTSRRRSGRPRRARDPIARFAEFLKKNGLATDERPCGDRRRRRARGRTRPR